MSELQGHGFGVVADGPVPRPQPKGPLCPVPGRGVSNACCLGGGSLSLFADLGLHHEPLVGPVVLAAGWVCAVTHVSGRQALPQARQQSCRGRSEPAWNGWPKWTLSSLLPAQSLPGLPAHLGPGLGRSPSQAWGCSDHGHWPGCPREPSVRCSLRVPAQPLLWGSTALWFLVPMAVSPQAQG